MDRFCIFCGDPPEDKDLEHPLPMWLLKMTGNPNRVVRHGFSWTSGKLFTFSFDSLKFPSCRRCNSSYSAFEERAKRLVESLCAYHPLRPDDYVLLLDWLDKVRVALWLGNQYLQKRFVFRHFTIDSRIGTTDRMVAIYALNDRAHGLNTTGTETPLFIRQPSIFGIRINNMLLLNWSANWRYSARCGFPFPKSCLASLDHDGGLLYSDVVTRRKVTHPLVTGLDRPAILMVQPVAQIIGADPRNGYTLEDELYCQSNEWPNRSRLGPLFQQLPGETIRHQAGGPPIEMSVKGQAPKRPMLLAAQIYDWQIEEALRREFASTDRKLCEVANAERKVHIRYNKVSAHNMRVPQAEYERQWHAATAAVRTKKDRTSAQ